MAIPTETSLQSQITYDGEGNPQLDLTRALMNDDPAFSQFLSVFWLSDLLIRQATVGAYDDDGNNFYVRGTVTLWSQTLDDLEIYYIIPEDQQTFAFQITVTFGEMSLLGLWNAIIPQNAINDIPALLACTFDDVNLIYDSVDYNLYFGTFEPPTPVNLDASVIGIPLGNMGFEVSRKYRTQQASWYLYADVPFGNTTVDMQIELPIGSLFASAYWIFRITDTLLLAEGFIDLLLFISGLNLGSLVTSLETLLPPQLRRIPAFFMYGMELHYDPRNCAYNFISFSTCSSYPFVIIENVFSITNVGFDLTFTLGSSSPQFAMTLFGSLALDEIVSLDMALYISSHFDDDWDLTMQGEIDLASITSLNLLPTNTPVSDFQLPPGLLTANDIKLKGFHFYFNPLELTVSEIQLELDFDGSLNLVPNIFSIQLPRFATAIQNPFNQSAVSTPRQITGSIQAYIVLGGTPDTEGGVSDPNAIVFDAAAFKNVDGWEFSGNTLAGQEIPIGQFIQQIADYFGVDTALPAPLAGLVIDKISLSFNTAVNHFNFMAEVDFPVGDVTLDATIGIDVIQQSDGGYRKTFSGKLIVADSEGDLNLEFDLIFCDDPTADYFLATFHDSAGAQVSVQTLVSCLISPTWASTYIPAGLVISLQDAVLAFASSGSGSGLKILFGLDIAAGVNLSNLPLIGQELAPDETLDLVFQVLVASSNFTVADVDALNALMPPASTPLPRASTASNSTDTAIAEGLDLTTQILFGTFAVKFDLPITIDGGGNLAPTQDAPIPSFYQLDTTSDLRSLTWFKIQKSFGPVYLDKIGGTVGYDTDLGLSAIFSLYGSIAEAGLSLSLDGLTISVGLTSLAPLDGFSVRFDLAGIGVEYDVPPLEIGASLLHTTGTFNGVPYDEYDGAAIFSIPGLTLAALASYADLGGVPSLFLYGVLDMPIGGPGFFFVDGLSAGFGVNRNLIIPDIDHVNTFPLVSAAVSGVDSVSGSDLNAMMTSMQASIPPMIGEYFFALGIKFSTYGVLDSFALLTVLLGDRIEVDILGLSTAVIPPPELDIPITPLAELQLALEGRFVPSEGFISLQAGLTSASYLLSRDCHITGGFAMYAWFSGDHAGDFVLTLGGYHPDFAIPAHYPQMAPLGLSWKILPELSVKGNIYFALVPSALMAGGHLEVTWNSGNISAWFKGDANFLLNWKPYFYRANLTVDVGASYTFDVLGIRKTVSFDVGADLELWGPDFSGRVFIDYTLVSFTIEFGAASAVAPAPIPWNTFADSFLPAADQCVGVSIESGLVAASSKNTADDNMDMGVINPQTLSLLVNSVIPIKTTNLPLGDPNRIDTAFGVAPMNLAPADFGSDLGVTMLRDGMYPVFTDDVDFIPVFKTMPVGLWGGSMSINLKAPTTIGPLLMGVRIVPRARPNPASTQAIQSDKLLISAEPIDDAFDWPAVTATVPSAMTDSDRRETIQNTLTDSAVARTRMGILAALDMTDIVIDLDDQVAYEFIDAPQISASTPAS